MNTDGHRYDASRARFSRRLTPIAQQREVLARLAETDASPGSLEPFEEEDLDRMIQDFAHARTKKPSAGQG